MMLMQDGLGRAKASFSKYVEAVIKMKQAKSSMETSRFFCECLEYAYKKKAIEKTNHTQKSPRYVTAEKKGIPRVFWTKFCKSEMNLHSTSPKDRRMMLMPINPVIPRQIAINLYDSECLLFKEIASTPAGALFGVDNANTRFRI